MLKASFIIHCYVGALVLLFFAFPSALCGQNARFETLGQVELRFESLEATLDEQPVVPTLKKEEGILRIKYGPKLKAYMAAEDPQFKAKPRLRLTDLTYDPQRTLLDLTASEFMLRYKTDYLLSVQTNRHILYLENFSGFETLRTTISLTKNKVNTFVLELNSRPQQIKAYQKKTLLITANVPHFKVVLSSTGHQNPQSIERQSSSKELRLEHAFSGPYTLMAYSDGAKPIEKRINWNDQLSIQTVSLTFSSTVASKNKTSGLKQRKRWLWVGVLSAIATGSYLLLQDSGGSSSEIPAPPGRPQ